MKKTLTMFMLAVMLVAAVVFPAVTAFAEGGSVADVPGADLVGTLLGYLPTGWGEWVTLVVTFCAAVAVVLPAPKDDSNIVWRGLYWLVQVLACNKGKAANAKDVSASSAGRLG